MIMDGRRIETFCRSFFYKKTIDIFINKVYYIKSSYIYKIFIYTFLRYTY